MEVHNEQDVALADALVQLRKQYDVADGGTPFRSNVVREPLANVLDLTNPGWRERPEVIERIRTLGVREAARKTLDKYGL